MIPNGAKRFSEKHALGLNPRVHAQARISSGMTTRGKVIATDLDTRVQAKAFVADLLRRRSARGRPLCVPKTLSALMR
jgi:hypothetical protein